MDYTFVVNAIISYGSVLMLVLLGLVAAVTMIVEVVKRLVPKIPTDLVVFVVSIAVSVLALLIYTAVVHITVVWYFWVAAVALGIAVAYISMFGWTRSFDSHRIYHNSNPDRRSVYKRVRLDKLGKRCSVKRLYIFGIAELNCFLPEKLSSDLLSDELSAQVLRLEMHSFIKQFI